MMLQESAPPRFWFLLEPGAPMYPLRHACYKLVAWDESTPLCAASKVAQVRPGTGARFNTAIAVLIVINAALMCGGSAWSPPDTLTTVSPHAAVLVEGPARAYEL